MECCCCWSVEQWMILAESTVPVPAENENDVAVAVVGQASSLG